MAGVRARTCTGSQVQYITVELALLRYMEWGLGTGLICSACGGPLVLHCCCCSDAERAIERAKARKHAPQMGPGSVHGDGTWAAPRPPHVLLPLPLV